MIFVAETMNGDRVEYRDAKRWLWVFFSWSGGTFKGGRAGGRGLGM